MKTIARLFANLFKMLVILSMVFAGAVFFGWAGSHLPGLWALPGMLAGYAFGCVFGGWLGTLLTGGIAANPLRGYSARGAIPSSYIPPNYGINPANGLPMRNATHDVLWNLKHHDFYREQAEREQQRYDQQRGY